MRYLNDVWWYLMMFLIRSSTWNVCCQNQERIFEKGLEEDRISDLISYAKDIQNCHVWIVKLYILDINLVDDCYMHNFRTYVFCHKISKDGKWIRSEINLNVLTEICWFFICNTYLTIFAPTFLQIKLWKAYSR